MKKIVIFLILLFVSVVASELLNSNAVASELQNDYEVTSVRDTLLTNDSILVIHTVCAPICSSHVRVYNKEWQYLGVLKAPFKSAFPEAYIENNKLIWRDNDTFDYTPCR
jgi:hypothetical protein